MKFLTGIANFFNARLILAALLAALAAATTGYVYGSKHTRAAIEADAAREERIAQVAYENALRATAEQIAGIQIVNKTIRQELEREIQKEPVYVDCRHSPDVKRLLDAILTGERPAESLGEDSLPAVIGTTE